MTFDDATTAHHQPGGVHPQRTKRRRRLVDEHALVGTAGAGEVAKALDGVHGWEPSPPDSGVPR